jgi:hypothetical protein
LWTKTAKHLKKNMSGLDTVVFFSFVDKNCEAIFYFVGLLSNLPSFVRQTT